MRPSTALKAIWPLSDGAQLLRYVVKLQRDEFVNDDEEEQHEDQLNGHDPAGEFGGLFGGAVFLKVAERSVGGEFEGFHAEHQGLAERGKTAQNGVFCPRIFFGEARDGEFFGDDVARSFADRDAIAVRGAHHDAFHDGLSADQRLFTGFENGEKLGVEEKAKESADGQVDGTSKLLLYVHWQGGLSANGG